MKKKIQKQTNFNPLDAKQCVLLTLGTPYLVPRSFLLLSGSYITKTKVVSAFSEERGV